MKKRAAKRSKAKKRPVPKLKRVRLAHDSVVEVIVPKGAMPIVATDPVKGVVSIIPITEEKLKERSWYERLFG